MSLLSCECDIFWLAMRIFKAWLNIWPPVCFHLTLHHIYVKVKVLRISNVLIGLKYIYKKKKLCSTKNLYPPSAPFLKNTCFDIPSCALFCLSDIILQSEIYCGMSVLVYNLTYWQPGSHQSPVIATSKVQCINM